jgi:hypothetical protein
MPYGSRSVKGSGAPYRSRGVELILLLPESNSVGRSLKEYASKEDQYREIESSHVKTLRKFVLMEGV